MKEEGHDEPSVMDKILGYFHLNSDTGKGVARSLLINGCEKLMDSLFGSEKAEEIKELRNRGASGDEYQVKMAELTAGLSDEEKEDALKYAPICKKVFTMIMR